jgi:hypothetical protein
MNRRSVLGGLGTVAAGLVAGCAGSGSHPDGGSRTESADAETTTYANALDRMRNQPDPNLAIAVENRDDSEHTVTIEISQSSETRYEETIAVDPGAPRHVYNLQRLNPEGIEEFTITARLGTESKSMDVRTSECFGNVDIWIREDATLSFRYSIC